MTAGLAVDGDDDAYADGHVIQIYDPASIEVPVDVDLRSDWIKFNAITIGDC